MPGRLVFTTPVRAALPAPTYQLASVDGTAVPLPDPPEVFSDGIPAAIWV